MPSVSLKLLQPLPDLVRSKYLQAQASGALALSPTHLTIVRVDGVPFQLRWCPALAKKPTGKESGIEPPPSDLSAPQRKKPDPFEDPSSDLLVERVPVDNPTHNVVLNKYPVIPQHFILATKEYKEQTDKLEGQDLAVTYGCLQNWGQGRLFAFFNSGEHSGASQGHRHIQFLPVEEMQATQEGQWAPLIDAMHQNGIQALDGTSTIASVPFAHFSFPIPAGPTPSTLLRLYESLYEVASVVLESSHDPKVSPVYPLGSGPRTKTISYNLAMTTSTMIICPRRSEGCVLIPEHVDQSLGNGSGIGPVALNGTMLAGTLMVKTETEWDALRGDNGATYLKRILEDVGVPQSHRHIRSEES